MILEGLRICSIFFVLNNIYDDYEKNSVFFLFFTDDREIFAHENISHWSS